MFMVVGESSVEGVNPGVACRGGNAVRLPLDRGRRARSGLAIGGRPLFLLFCFCGLAAGLTIPGAALLLVRFLFVVPRDVMLELVECDQRLRLLNPPAEPCSTCSEVSTATLLRRLCFGSRKDSRSRLRRAAVHDKSAGFCDEVRRAELRAPVLEELREFVLLTVTIEAEEKELDRDEA